MKENSQKEDLLLVGKIIGTWGLKGHLKILSWCDPKENIFSYSKWLLSIDEYANSHYTVKVNDYATARSGKVLVARLESIQTIEESEQWLNYNIHVKKSDLIQEEGSFYWHELVGMKVSTEKDVFLGEVIEILETGTHDVLKIKSENKQSLIPFVWDKYILSVSCSNRSIIVDWEEDW